MHLSRANVVLCSRLVGILNRQGTEMTTQRQTAAAQGDWGPDVLEGFSDLLLKLYRTGRTAPADVFQAHAFTLLENFISFDAAYWGLAAVDTGPGVDYIGAQVLDVYLHRCPPKTYERYIRHRGEDLFVAAASNNPGVTIATSFRNWYPESFWPYADKFSFYQYMITIVKHPPTDLETGITLMRADAGRPFSETERRMKQALMPHLIEAFARSQIEPWLRDTLPAPQFTAAIVDEFGALRHAADGFGAMLQTEWPQWRGPALPEPLRTLMATDKTGHYSGARIAASFHRHEHMALLQLRPARLADHLSEQQLSVARHTADGLNHKEISRLMQLSPATVRNYLSNVYRKLGVKNKLQLAEALREAE